MTTQHPLDAFGFRLRELIQRGFPADDETFNRLALELFALQFEHNKPCQKLCRHRGVTPEHVSAWRDIPAMPTSAFKDFDLTSLAPEERTTVFHSSGTTEHRPSRHFHNAASRAVYEASLLAWFRWHLIPGRGIHAATATREDAASQQPVECPTNGLDHRKVLDCGSPLPLSTMTQSTRGLAQSRTLARPESQLVGSQSQCAIVESSRLPVLALTPCSGEAPHSSLVHMFETVTSALGREGSQFVGQMDTAESWTLNATAALTALREFQASGQAAIILGTAFSIVHLLDLLEAHGERVALAESSRVMETGGYKGRSRELSKAELHRLITERLGIPASHIVCEYGMSELSSQAYARKCRVRVRAGLATTECGTRRARFAFPPWARVHIVSPETGWEVSEGETGLIRVFDLANVRSVLSVQTEDLGVRRHDGFELVGRAALAEARGCSLMAV